MNMHESILEAVHATAQGLHQNGVMKRETLREFDGLGMTSTQVKEIPLKNGDPFSESQTPKPPPPSANPPYCAADG
jgi:hypothetical protein